MSKKIKTQKLIYIVAVPVDQKEINALGFGEWLKLKRIELVKMYHAESVTISVFGKAVYIIGVEEPTETIDKVGFSKFLFKARMDLIEQFNTKQAFVVAV